MAMVKLIGIEEAASILGHSRCWVYRKVEAGEIPHIRLGRDIRFVETKLLEWVEAHSKPGTMIASLVAQAH